MSNFSCEVKSKAGVEALVLPLELPQDAGSAHRLIGKGMIDWTGVDKSTHIDTIATWGPYYRIAFDLYLNSPPPDPLITTIASVLDFKILGPYESKGSVLLSMLMFDSRIFSYSTLMS